MRHRRDEAYVLGTHDLGDTDVIVTLVAEHAGRVRGVAPSARRSRRRFGGALEPLSRVQASWVEREGRELHRIESLDLERSFARMQADPVLQAACAIVGDIAAKVSREEQPDPTGFRLLGAVLEALEGGLDPWVAIRYFEYWTLKVHGVLPDLDACAACESPLPAGGPVRLLDSGGCGCDACAAKSSKALRDRDREFLRALGRRPPAEVAAHGSEARPGGAVEALLKGALEAFVDQPIRTYRHLRALRA